jgi:ElaA protein
LNTIKWCWARFDDLSPRDVYDLLALRNAVFGIEQNCVYLDADGKDFYAWHLLGRTAGGELLAYLRLVDPGKKFVEPSIGRVVTHAKARSAGLGRALMQEGLNRCQAVYGSMLNRIGAQARLEQFYASLGYHRVSENYMEDGIAHLDMLHLEK